MSLPIYEIFIEDTDDVGIALVDLPAIESDFMFFKSEKPIKMIFNDEKMIVKGPALIPNKLMYKAAGKFPERYVFYSEDTIQNFVELIMNKKNNKFNLLHTDNYIEANVIESYFATEPNEFGVPKNSWIVSAKIKDAEVWEKIKSGEYRGFSVEGLFYNKITEITETFNKKTKSNMNELKEKIFSAINNILFDEKPTEVSKDKEDFSAEGNQKVDEKVEDKIEDTKEEKVEDTKEDFVEETNVDDEKVKEENNEDFSLESVKLMLEEFKSLIVENLETQLNEKMEEMRKEVTKVDQKVEEFSKQPLTQSIVDEEVANTSAIKNSSKAAQFFTK